MRRLLEINARFAAAFWLLAGCLSACGHTTTCGPGTVEVGGACLADPDAVTCGPGTELVGGHCVADATAADTSTGTDAVAADVGEDAADVLDAQPDAASDTAVDIAGTDAEADELDAPDTADATDTPDTIDASDVIVCQPLCAGRECGPDNCGGQCGTCTTAEAPFCDEISGQCNAQCVPDAWTCAATAYAAGDACDCACGAVDPDCLVAVLGTVGCGAYEECDSSGKCVSTVPAAWTCNPFEYNGLDYCNCGCGAPDPDCDYGLPLKGCLTPTATCDASGVCQECAPDCTGKACGSDGCGGICGECNDPVATACDAGVCVDPCAGGVPLVCKTAQCGDDGCGGTCGTCDSTKDCKAGACVPKIVVDPASCAGNCGSIAPIGCYCVAGCETDGSCCADYAALCKCTPNCTDKTCGSDGCGGTCGTCGGGSPYCDATGNCTATCTPQCDGKTCGDDGCGGNCGTCGSGMTCSYADKCIPSAWKCDPGSYQDAKACDCGCGAVDPDCSDAALSVFGCPAGDACSATGFCSATFCANDSECGVKWCTGAWPKSSGFYGGVCATPLAAGQPAGTVCEINEQCASNLCLEGFCRTHCSVDAGCPANELCLGLSVLDGISGSLWGFAAACDLTQGSGTTCKAQSDCKANFETCVARVDPTTLGPRYVCELVPNAPAAGNSCAATACPAWQICAESSNGAVCALPCPGGAKDCPSGWTCQQKPLHNNGTPDPADDPQVPLCLPN